MILGLTHESVISIFFNSRGTSQWAQLTKSSGIYTALALLCITDDTPVCIGAVQLLGADEHIHLQGYDWKHFGFIWWRRRMSSLLLGKELYTVRLDS